MTHVFPQPFIRCSLQCRDLVDEAKKFHLRPELRSQMQGPRTRARLGEQQRTGRWGVLGRWQVSYYAPCLVPCKCTEVLHSSNLSIHCSQGYRKGTGARDRGTIFFRAQLLTGNVGTSWLPLIPGLCCNHKTGFLCWWYLQIRLPQYAAVQEVWEEFPSV